MLTNTERQQIVEEVNAGTYGIDEALDDIAAAQKGEEVRKALYAEALALNREGHAGSTDMIARQQIANLQTSVNGQISTFRTEVGEDIDDLETALNSGLAAQNGKIAAQNATIANVVANYNVEYGSTELWASTGETGALAAGTTVELSEDVSHFDYIDIYSFCGNSNVLDTVPVDAKLQSSQGYALRWVNLSDPGSGSYKAYVRIIETRLHIIGTTLTIDHQVTYRNGEEVNISGAEITQSNRTTYMGELGIMKIVGRKITANTEIEDVRIGADGTEYASAGQAVRAQVTALESAIPAVDSTLSTQGAAADAKVAGDKVAELTSENEMLHNNTTILANGEFDKGALIDDIYIRSSNGAEASYAGCKATGFIALYGITKLYAYVVSGSNGYAENAFYDANKAFISSFRTPNGESEHIIPSNAAYVRFSNKDEAMDSLRIYTVGGAAYANSGVYRSQAGIIAQNITQVSIPAGNNSPVTLLTGISLQPGTYYLSCEQQTSLVSTTRNVLFYRKSGQDRVFDNTAVDVIFAGHRMWRFTILEAGTYDFGVWVVENSGILLIDNVVLASMPEPETIPNYYTVQLNQAATNFNALTASGDGDTFVFITDIHYPNNRMFSPLLAKWVCDATNTRRIIINGDYINKEDTKANALNMICRTAALYNFPGINTYRAVGNHEYNNPSASNANTDLAKELSVSELKNAITNTNVPGIVYDNNTLSYYFDNARKKIRYLVGSVDRASSIPVAAVKFIADHINDAPDGYTCVIINHTVLTYTNNQPAPIASAAPLVTLIDAVRNHGSVTIQGTSYNFSGRNVDVAGVLCGDYHLDMVYRTSGGVPIIATTCDTLQEAGGGLSRKLGTISESAFDVIYINTVNRIINLRRIGAGADRNVTFDA